MEEYKKQLTIYETFYDWKNSVSYFRAIESKLSDVEKLNFSVRVMFLINYWFLEGRYSQQEQAEGMQELLALYEKSKARFRDDPDFLFSVAIITGLNEFPFNMNLDDSAQLLQDAIQGAPDTRLYLYWFLAATKNLPVDKEYLHSNFVSSWREDKGLLGKYVVDYLRSCN